MQRLCYCGCEKEVKEQNRFIHGHQFRGKKHKEESKSKMKETHWSRNPKQRERVSEIIKRQREKEGAWKKEKNPFYGIHRTGKMNPSYNNPKMKETAKKMGDANRGKKRSEEFKEKRRIYMINAFKDPSSAYNSEEYKKKKSISLSGKNNPMYGIKPSKEVIENNRKRMIELNKDPEFIKKRFKCLMKKPTKPEIQLDTLLQKNFPNEWKYVGDGEIVIGTLCPDFININGKKLIIELFGDYWHNREGMKFISTERGRKEIFKRYGFDTLIVWENELKSPENVIENIKRWL